MQAANSSKVIILPAFQSMERAQFKFLPRDHEGILKIVHKGIRVAEEAISKDKVRDGVCVCVCVCVCVRVCICVCDHPCV